MPVKVKARTVIETVDNNLWKPTLDASGFANDVEKLAVVEITGLVSYEKWPADMRLITRQERPHPGAQLDLFEERDGYLKTLIAINTTTGQLQQLEARHRAHARIESPPQHHCVIVAVGGTPRIKDAKATGLDTMTSNRCAPNLVWTQMLVLATILMCWCQLIGLADSPHRDVHPKKLRYRLFGAAAQVVRPARQLRVRLSASWQRTKDLLDADVRGGTYYLLVT